MELQLQLWSLIGTVLQPLNVSLLQHTQIKLMAHAETSAELGDLLIRDFIYLIQICESRNASKFFFLQNWSSRSLVNDYVLFCCSPMFTAMFSKFCVNFSSFLLPANPTACWYWFSFMWVKNFIVQRCGKLITKAHYNHWVFYRNEPLESSLMSVFMSFLFFFSFLKIYNS